MNPEFIDPEMVLEELELRPEMRGAEFGCGSGHWALSLARILHKGLVYALDVQSGPLSALRARADRESIPNLQVLQRDLAKEEGSKLPSNSLDIVLIPNLLFQVEEKEVVLKEAKRILQPEGLLLVVDWRKRERLTSSQSYVTAEQVKSMVQKLGFELEKEFEAGESHYALIFKKENV
jgi:ubiquinone/menaquinone biosynthesis C-methylase UbiE